MQSKLRKASTGGKSVDAGKSTVKRDMSTSTEDLGKYIKSSMELLSFMQFLANA